MTFLARLAFSAILTTAALFAQDVTGRWTGAADTTDEGATKRQEKQTFEIVNEGGKLVANSINREGKVSRSMQVQQDGAKFNIYYFLDFEGGEHLRWKLELKDGALVGTFSAQHDSPKKWVYDRVGAITFTRVSTAR